MPRMSTIFVALFAAMPVAAQEHVFTPHNVARLRAVTSAVISPDGTQIAYVLTVPRNLPKEKDGGAWNELHVVDVKGNSTPYITGQVSVDAIAWTPDGKGIAFLAKRDADAFKSLYVIPVRGGEAKRVLTHGSDILSFSWGRGNQIAYLAAEPPTKEQRTQQDQGFTQEIYEESLPFVRGYVATLAAGEKPAVPVRMLKLQGSASEVHWSPTEDKIAVALAPAPLIDDHLMFRKVHIVDVKSGKAINLSNPGKMGQLAWSPDGKFLALISGVATHDPKEGRLWVFTGNTTGWSDVAPSHKGHVESVAWRDPQNVVFQAASYVWTSVSRAGLKPDSEGAEIIGRDGPILSNITASADGKTLAFVGHTPLHPPEVYLHDSEYAKPR